MGMKEALKTRETSFRQKLNEAAEARAERERVWDVYRAKAREWINANATDEEKSRMALDDKWATEFVQSIAENLSIADFKIPPGWTGWIHCERCGTVPAWPSLKGQNVKGCPWCHIVGDVIEEAKSDIAAFESRGTSGEEQAA